MEIGECGRQAGRQEQGSMIDRQAGRQEQSHGAGRRMEQRGQKAGERERDQLGACGNKEDSGTEHPFYTPSTSLGSR